MKRLYLIKWKDLDSFRHQWLIDRFDQYYWPWDEMIKSKIGDYLILFVNLKKKELIGTITLKILNNVLKKEQGLSSLKGRVIDIKNVWIFKEFRGQGYCSEMLKRSKKLIKRRKLGNKIKLDVEASNLVAIKCYQHIMKKYDNTKAEKLLHQNFKSRYGFEPGNRKFIIMIGNIY